MKKTFWKPLAAGLLLCLGLTACSNAYAATAGTIKDNETKAEETAAETDRETETAAKEEKTESGKDKNVDRASVSASAQEALESLFASASVKEPRTITVSASGSVKTVPDKAELSFGVTTQAKAAEDAQKKNAETIDKVIEYLRERGIEEKSISTSSYNLYPQYDYNGNTPRITGYEVRTTLSVRDQEIDEAGELISEVVKLGVNDVDSFRFYASDYDEAYQDALKKAVEAAAQKAEILAESADAKLGPILSIQEGYQDTSYRYSKSRYAVTEAAMDMASGSMSVMPGEAEISAQVTVTFTMQ